MKFKLGQVRFLSGLSATELIFEDSQTELLTRTIVVTTETLPGRIMFLVITYRETGKIRIDDPVTGIDANNRLNPETTGYFPANCLAEFFKAKMKSLNFSIDQYNSCAPNIVFIFII